MSARRIIDFTQELTRFFGCDLAQVSPMNRLMALHQRPDWLRGRPKLLDLPRALPADRAGLFFEPVPLITDREIANRLTWVIENLHGGWAFDERGFGFENEAESLYFRLRFSDG